MGIAHSDGPSPVGTVRLLFETRPHNFSAEILTVANVRDFGARGDGQTDDTEAIQHALRDGDGCVEFPRGDYRVTRTIAINLAQTGRVSLQGAGGTPKILMEGSGPAFFFQASHLTSSADPNGFRPEEWQRERMPTVKDLEIEGRHAEADGVRFVGVMQPSLHGVLIRHVRHAVVCAQRCRNLLISHCHIYHNTGIGVHLDHCNLHQVIVCGSHLSYNRLGGIRIDGGEIRNVQITGNDIEYNNNRAFRIPDADAVPTAEIYIDAQDGSIREGTIASNTIQATYSPGGANIRLIGGPTIGDHRMGMWTIGDNLIGSQNLNVHLTNVRGVTITGNYLYSGHQRNLLVEGSRNIAVGPNVFEHNPDYQALELATGIRFVDCEQCNLQGILIQDALAGRHTVPGAPPLVRDGLIELIRCKRMNLNGLQVLEGTPYGIYLEDCSETLLTGCTVLDGREPKLMKASIHWRGPGQKNQIAVSRLGSGLEGTIQAGEHVRLVDNLLDS